MRLHRNAPNLPFIPVLLNTAVREKLPTDAITGSTPVISDMKSQRHRGVRVHGVVRRHFWIHLCGLLRPVSREPRDEYRQPRNELGECILSNPRSVP
jgi:hypothetical protein